MADQNKNKEQEVEEITMVLATRFGDEHSTLFDQFERLSFEIQLNQAILGRSLSEPSLARPYYYQAPLAQPPLVLTQVQQGRRRCIGSGFRKVLKKLLKPITGRMRSRNKEVVDPNPKDSISWMRFSRSMRF